MATQPLGPYVIGERVGTSVWMAEDTRTGRRVAIKLLSKQLPKDETRREAILKEVRVAASLQHQFVVPIIEIAAAGDNLLMVMEVVEGQALSKRLHGAPLDRAEFFRTAFQLASALKYLHTKRILHGNLNGDSVMVKSDGHVVLGGLDLENLTRREYSSQSYQQKAGDVRSVSYMAPEQISSQTVEERSDIFSMGIVFYEMATGKLPFSGNAGPEVARAIVEGQPASPKAMNPQIDAAVMTVLGTCLFKDPAKRAKDVRAVVETIDKLDPGASQFAARFSDRRPTSPGAAAPAAAAPPPPPAATPKRKAILFIADVANFGELLATSPERAERAAARMQQILGESVYLFDGHVVDPFGPRMIAELPTIESALEAGRKGEFDFSPGQQDGEPIEVHMLLHAGELDAKEGAVSGPALDKAAATLPQLPANTLYISEDFAKAGRGNVRLRDAGARGGVKLFTIVAPEPVAAPPPTDEPEPTTAELEAEAAAELGAVIAEHKAAKKKQSLGMVFAVAASLLLLVAVGAVVMWMRRSNTNESPQPVATATVAPTPQIPTAHNPRKVHIAPFEVETPDPLLTERANTIRLGAMGILRTFPELRVSDDAAQDAMPFTARVRNGPAGAEIVPVSGTKAGYPAAMLDVASGIRAMVQWVTNEAQVPPRSYAVPDALNSFADAVVARSMNDPARADTSLRASMQSDPSFLPAQMLAMEFFASQGKDADAIAAAKQVVALDPANLDAARRVARASLMGGDLQQAFSFYDLVLQREPSDAEALNLLARYSAATGDAPTFTAALSRLRRLPPMQRTSHEPDLIAAQGRIDAAMQRYYAVEEQTPNTPSLALKIGRLSVLRHSLEMANLQLSKLEQHDPLYGHHMLKAYIAAEKRQNDVAAQELETALASAVPGDESWTYAAEVHAIMNDTPAALASLEKAVQRKEPTAGYILASPLFRYLQNDPRFASVRESLIAQQGEIRTALAQVK
jgi:tetratricopeptide (TPR) repeat protein/tRNA A-37 threonylcarbamoyl transferase component Bud32